ncbi:hypothetical protein NE579_01335 [Intestinimonas massiliensis]|uniref:Uncharacterized protein n=1 Tax=Intestinimonas massiliensis (ex Afouda et al. 2020) TaxID=1673721 RepID=A0AAW5JN76_9FIRM|nr:hypothetical protein [Intestinimonas massiliensis (ex Afouda et al. 2020)]MCQ4769108.1 hypothetical protein [Intestinimonas massiliensis (ex Afouda et al. 2020)]
MNLYLDLFLTFAKVGVCGSGRPARPGSLSPFFLREAEVNPASLRGSAAPLFAGPRYTRFGGRWLTA